MHTSDNPTNHVVQDELYCQSPMSALPLPDVCGINTYEKNQTIVSEWLQQNQSFNDVFINNDVTIQVADENHHHTAENNKMWGKLDENAMVLVHLENDEFKAIPLNEYLAKYK